MKMIRKYLIIFICCGILAAGCRNRDAATEDGSEATPQSRVKTVSALRNYESIPGGIQWLTNDHDPIFSSLDARKGGVIHAAILSFPMTFRSVGPDSNGSFAGYIRDNNFSLIGIHPETGRIIPELATHWAFDDDQKTMYFRLDPKARWSDGEPVTAWDYVYTLTFMRSAHIMAPFYNDYYSREIEKVMVYDDYTIGVRSAKAVPDLHLQVSIGPVPEHYFRQLTPDFVQAYNWSIVPNTGPYQISDFKKGKYVRYERKKDWWAKDHRYFKNRYNVDQVIFDVVRDFNMTWEFFKKGKIEMFPLTFPEYWHDRSDIDIFKNGYANKIWFYNDIPQSAQGMWLNQDIPIFRDRNVRLAFAHAMNVEKVIQGVLRNDYMRLPQAFFGYGDYTDPSIVPRKFDISTVESLMKISGWDRGPDGIWQKSGQRFSIEVTYGFDGYTPRLVVLKEDALKAGIELRLQNLDSNTSFKKFLEKKHEVAWMGWSTSLRPSYWQGWHSDNAHKTQTNNITNTDDPALDALIDQYRSSLDSPERIRLSREIQRVIHDIGAFVPTFMVPYVRHAYWRWIRLPSSYGTRRSDDLFAFFNSETGGLFWVDQDIKDQTLAAMKNNETFEPIVIIDETFKMGIPGS